MGNSNRKRESTNLYKSSNHVTRDRQNYFSQFSLANIASNLSGRSFASVASQQSSSSVSRPWSRVSRRRWKQSTLTEPFEASKTAWPVAHIESAFLPEFPLNSELTENSFCILDFISYGAYGKVYKVQKLDNRQIYALKILSKAQIISENAVRQVKEEVSIQSLCGHNPFIVNCPFYWQSRRKLYIVSDFIVGGELHNLCETYNTLPEELVTIYVAEIALALDFLHNAGVIYRDLKAENVLLDQDGHIRLIDFGLSKWLNYGARTSTLCGTFRYMAPEIALLQPYGHAVDWWSLGVLTCKMLTGKYPVPAVPKVDSSNLCEELLPGDLAVVQESGTNYIGQIPGTLPEECSNLSVAARDLLGRLLERNPNVRLRSLYTLQGIAFFKGYNFTDVKNKKIIPKNIFKKHFSGQETAVSDLAAEFRNFSFQAL